MTQEQLNKLEAIQQKCESIVAMQEDLMQVPLRERPEALVDIIKEYHEEIFQIRKDIRDLGKCVIELVFILRKE